MDRTAHITGCILGTAVADAIGLPREGLSRRRAERLFGGPPLRHALIAGRGMCSDDTEHTVMVAQSLVAAEAEPNEFRRDFARRLRWWFLRIPAGVGFGTLRACLKLWCGISPERSGVDSAGNGPAMRSALLGIVASSDENLAELVRASTRVTHADPRAEQGARAVAAITRLIVAADGRRLSGKEVRNRVLSLVDDTELHRYLGQAIEAGERGVEPRAFAEQLGLAEGVSGFIVHSVPVAVFSWFAHQGNFRNTVEVAVCFGGDTDTVAAIAGALAGTQVGVDGIPVEWIDKFAEWPCTVEWMKGLASAVSDTSSGGVVSTVPTLSPILMLIRNLLFAAIVVLHALRRLLPPY